MTSSNRKSAYALLGLLTIEPMTGYDMRKFIDSTISHFWKESWSNIYTVLKKLKQEKLVVSQKTRQTGKPDKLVYKLTAKGQRVFDAWLAEPAREEAIKSELLLKMFFGSRLEPEFVVHQLEEYQVQQENLRQYYRKYRQELESSSEPKTSITIWKLMLNRGEMVAQARAKWARQSLKKLHDLAQSEIKSD